jgi:hypothetical protein
MKGMDKKTIKLSTKQNPYQQLHKILENKQGTSYS